MMGMSSSLGQRLARFLACSRHVHGTAAPADLTQLQACLRPGDVLLVEGNSRISTAIKYLTQSTWSHAALYVWPRPGLTGAAGDSACLVEAHTVDGVRAVGLSTYAGLHVRVCRPASLSAEDGRRLVNHAIGRIGHRYDLRNIFDLARFLIATPPMPVQWRRRLLVLGSGDPTRAICSTLIAQAFESVRLRRGLHSRYRCEDRYTVLDRCENSLHWAAR